MKLDVDQKIKAVCIVHNETSTGCTSDVKAVRQVLDNLKHDALLMVDSISGLASMNYEHDNWGVDVTISGSQKGLMLPLDYHLMLFLIKHYRHQKIKNEKILLGWVNF